MAVSKALHAQLEELLEPLGAIRIRAMFGGAGLFLDDRMFGLVAADVLYFKVDAQNLPAYEAEDLPPFTYTTKTGRNSIMSYRRAPDRVFDDPDEMMAWAREAVAAAARAAPARKPSLKRQPSAPGTDRCAAASRSRRK